MSMRTKRNRLSMVMYRYAVMCVSVVVVMSTWSVCPGETSVLPGDVLGGFSLAGGLNAELSRVPVAGMPFGEALHVDVLVSGLTSSDVRLWIANTSGVSAGDVLVLTFYHHRVDDVTAWGDMVTMWENEVSPQRRSLGIQWHPRGEWRRQSFPFICLEDAPPGAGRFSFDLGSLAQSIEVGGISLLNYGPRGVMGSDVLSQFNRGTIVTVTDHPGYDEALQLSCTTVPVNPWGLQATAPVQSVLDAGDSMAAVFHLKYLAGDADQAVVGPVLERAGDPWTKSLDRTILSDVTGWKHVILPFKMVESYASGGANFHFRLGYQVQELAICGVELLDFGTDLDADDLTPVYGIAYPGHDPDAPWREATRQRIDQVRKSDLQVHVTDLSGNDVAGASVEVRMQRHAFRFGSAVDANWLSNTTPDGLQYQQVIRDTFNVVVLENDLKWPGWESQPQRARDGIQWCIDNGIPLVRGHNLVWPSWRYMPSDVQDLYGDDLRNRILNHIQDELGDYGVNGRCVDWDVVNEPYTNHDVMDRLDDYSVMQDWFHLARQVDPGSRLFFNDYSLLTNGGATQAKQDYYLDMIQTYQSAGVPLDGMGFQGHFGGSVTGPETVYAILERFSPTGLVLQVTEYDHAIDDELLQADYLRDFLTVVFSHGSVDSFLMWGFWDGKHWKGNAPLYRQDWSLKPSGEVWYDLIFTAWWTDEDLVTDTSGLCGVTGFHGDYELTISAGGVSEVVSATLPAGGETVEVTLPLGGDTPASPSNLVATAVSGSEVQLSWQDNADDESGFIVQRRAGDVAFTDIAVLGVDVTSYTDSTGVAGLVEYVYRVGAFSMQ